MESGTKKKVEEANYRWRRRKEVRSKMKKKGEDGGAYRNDSASD